MSQEPRPGLRQRLVEALLTAEPTQRIRLAQSALAGSLMAFSTVVLVYSAWIAGTPATWVAAWSTLSLGGFALAFFAIRAGWTRRLPDPALTLEQMVFAVTLCAVAYAMAGPVRGAAFPVVFVTLMFGLFRLSPRTMIWVGFYAAGLFGAVMALMAFLRPQVYAPAVELGHFVMLAAMLAVISLLAGQLSRLRERNRDQRSELAQALARIQELATRDELTGLINRRQMTELLELERQRGTRMGRSFCLAVIDIDHFKQINDRLGHACGDAVLRGFAQQSLAATRGGDILARWGGEEFVLLLADAQLSQALGGVERLRQQIESSAMLASEPTLRVTVSAGLTEYIAGEAISDALARADSAMYAAKAGGRNQTVVADGGNRGV